MSYYVESCLCADKCTSGRKASDGQRRLRPRPVAKLLYGGSGIQQLCRAEVAGIRLERPDVDGFHSDQIKPNRTMRTPRTLLRIPMPDEELGGLRERLTDNPAGGTHCCPVVLSQSERSEPPSKFLSKNLISNFEVEKNFEALRSKFF